MWEYLVYEFGTSYVDTIQNITIYDSTDFNGNIFMTQHGRSINPIGKAYFFPDTAWYEIDLNKNLYEGNTNGSLLYKLDAVKGEIWRVDKSEFAKVLDVDNYFILNKNREIKHIKYFSANDISDTLTWLEHYTVKIADSLGLIFKTVGETSISLNLIGAVIDGNTYGDTTLVSIKEKQKFSPVGIRLFPNYPNPFNPATNIKFEIIKPANISLYIYNILGTIIYKLIDKQYFNVGVHSIIWNGINDNGNKAASGIYFYTLFTNDQIITRSMLLIK